MKITGLNIGMQAHLHRQAWGSALARAKGERILDDPKLLRK